MNRFDYFRGTVLKSVALFSNTLDQAASHFLSQTSLNLPSTSKSLSSTLN